MKAFEFKELDENEVNILGSVDFATKKLMCSLAPKAALPLMGIGIIRDAADPEATAAFVFLFVVLFLFLRPLRPPRRPRPFCPRPHALLLSSSSSS